MKTLYVHLPFCTRKCPYCSFAVSIGQEHRIDRYIHCLLTEAETYRGTPVTSVYMGGGTPSLLHQTQISDLLCGLRAIFDFKLVEECTFEINPESFTAEKGRLCVKAE